MFQKCTSGHIEATQLDVVDIVRKIIHTGNTVVTKRKTAAKGESQFVVKQENFGDDEILDDDPLNDLLADTFNFDDDKDVGNSNNKPTITTTTTAKLKGVADADVVGKFKNTEEEVVIKVNNKVTTCDVDIEICCEIEKQVSPPQPLQSPPSTPKTIPDVQGPTTQNPTSPKPEKPQPPPPSSPKCGVRNEDGLVITAKNPSEKEAR